MTDKLGKIVTLAVRTHWKNEAADFTPWLAREENIALLGDEIGLELEVENTEVAVGPYWADILAKDTGTGRYVVIENQLGKTDHDHLGKLITYGAVLDATAVVWIAPEFTEEHKKALDWLNDNSADSISFLGVRLELWKIDESLPAVRFNVVSQPADIVRSAAKVKSDGELTEVKRLQGDWWEAVRQHLLEAKVVSSAQKARPQYWYDVALGRSGFVLSNIANTTDNRIGVRLYMSHRHNALVALAHSKPVYIGLSVVPAGELMEFTQKEKGSLSNLNKIIGSRVRGVLVQGKQLGPDHNRWVIESKKEP